MAARFRTVLDASLHNLYGPTEASVDVTWWDCAAAAASATVPIGRPIANTQTYVLNAHLEPQPIGVAGELRRPAGVGHEQSGRVRTAVDGGDRTGAGSAEIEARGHPAPHGVIACLNRRWRYGTPSPFPHSTCKQRDALM